MVTAVNTMFSGKLETQWLIQSTISQRSLARRQLPGWPAWSFRRLVSLFFVAKLVVTNQCTRRPPQSSAACTRECETDFLWAAPSRSATWSKISATSEFYHLLFRELRRVGCLDQRTYSVQMHNPCRRTSSTLIHSLIGDGLWSIAEPPTKDKFQTVSSEVN
jgi:hypothetical protein